MTIGRVAGNMRGMDTMGTPADQAWLAGESALKSRDNAQARDHYRRALALEPRHVPSLLGLSTAQMRLSDHRAAHAATMAADACRPTHPALVFGLAQQLRYFHEYEALEACLRTPGFAANAPVLIVAKGAVMLSSIGAHAAAVALADAAIEREPDSAASLYVRGNLHLFEGQSGDAERCYEAALAADPRLYQAAWMEASTRTQTAGSNHVERLRRQLAQAQPGGEGENYLAFGLHKELHDLGRHEEAWEALERGCRSRRAMHRYSLAEDAAVVDAMSALCTPAFVAAHSSVPQERVPIFIVGMHRSGTTLMERILARHSQVGDAGETYAFEAALQMATNHASMAKPDLVQVERAASADFDFLAERYARSARWLAKGKPWFTEKLPMNFWYAGLIAKAIPQARILHLARDPMDTCFSNLRTLFSGVALYSYDQAELGGFYLQYRRMMAHWRETLPEHVLDVSYDELVADPETSAKKIAAFCGLEFEPGMVDANLSSSRAATASAVLAREGIRKDRGRHWLPYERHLGVLRATLVPAYESDVP